MDKVSKGPEETLQSLSIHGRWTQFPEMFWSIRWISPHPSYKGVQVSAFRSNHVQVNARNTSKGALAITPRLSNGRGALYWPEQGCSPLHPRGLAPKPFPQYFHHPFFCWSLGGAIDNLCGEVMLQHVEAVTGLWRGNTFPCTPRWWSRAGRNKGTGGALQQGHALPSACPGLGEHSI